MTLAILCSGQGNQHEAMFALTGAAPAAAPLFDHARRLLGGIDPRDLLRGGRWLHSNRIGQILCTLQPLAVRAMLGDGLPARRIVAGYSVGEIAAWSLAGAVAPERALDLAATRAEAMDAVNPPDGSLLFVRGLAAPALDRLCADHHLAVAIINPGEAVVLGGIGPDLDAAMRSAMAQGATRAARIAVAVASHTPHLARAAASFRRSLASTVSADARIPPGVRLLSGIDAAPVVRIAAGLDKLGAQIAQTVRWADCLDAAVEAGATAFLELGPGRALAEMAGHAYPRLPARSIEDFRTPDGIEAWLARDASTRDGAPTTG